MTIELPSYYQPYSRLYTRLAHYDNTLIVRVIKAFAPFTMAQIILVERPEGDVTASQYLYPQDL
jgi:hypothetical protein